MTIDEIDAEILKRYVKPAVKPVKTIAKTVKKTKRFIRKTRAKLWKAGILPTKVSKIIPIIDKITGYEGARVVISGVTLPSKEGYYTDKDITKIIKKAVNDFTAQMLEEAKTGGYNAKKRHNKSNETASIKTCC